MAFTTIAFYETTPGATVLIEQDPCADDHVTVGPDLIVVPELNNLMGVMAFGVDTTRAQIATPSIRKIGYHELSKLSLAADPIPGVERLEDYSEAPIPLVHGESLQFRSSTTAGNITQAIVWLSDGPVTPIKGPVRTIMYEFATVTPAGAWLPVVLVATQVLPAGRYAIVGMQVITANVVHAARLVPIAHPWRPGVPTNLRATADLSDKFRNGNKGVFCEFEFDQPPGMQLMGTGASGAGQLYLDIVQTRAGR